MRIWFSLLVCVVLAGSAIAKERPPNLIVIMADDMGWAGLSCFGNPHFKTPHLDRLAEEGLRFTDFHSSGAVCSPTRAGLLTGRYQQRTGVDGVVNADPKVAYYWRGLQPREVTFAEGLKTAGYATAIFGKWHVGYLPKYNPLHQGFDRFRGFVSGNIDYRSHYDRMETFDWWQDLKKQDETGYSTHLINAHAVRFIEENKDRPLCIYVAHEAIHNPNQGPHDPPIRGPNKKPSKSLSPLNEAVKAMTLAMDECVGQIRAKLVELGLEKNTLVWFFSDNGGTRQNRSTGPRLRGLKGSVWEVGHRVPAIAWWPGRIAAGTVSHETCITLDVMPTLLSLAGGSMPKGHMLDGVDLGGILLKQAPLPARKLFWATQSRGKSIPMAMRDGSWKLVRNTRGAKGIWLANLKTDLAEKTNLANQQPQRVARMLAGLAAWHKDVKTGATPQPGKPGN